MQLSHFTAFWLRLAGNILLDLFLYVHMFCSHLRARDYTTCLTGQMILARVHLSSKGVYQALGLLSCQNLEIHPPAMAPTIRSGSVPDTTASGSGASGCS